MPTHPVPSTALDSEPRLVAGEPTPGARNPAHRVLIAKRSRRGWAVLLLGAALIAAGAALYFYGPGARRPAAPPEPAPTPTAAAPDQSQAPVEPAIRYPVERIGGAPEASSARAALPPLDGSDALAKEAIATMQNGDTWLRLLVPENIIRHIVATIDGLPQKTVAVQVLPVRPVPGLMMTVTDASGTAIAPENSARYAPYTSAAEAIDAERLAGFYVRFYPLFQQAYVELGYPKGYFNDRVIAVIDHLLAAPEPATPVYLTQNKVLYEFADPKLENLSAGQKTLVRIGLDNERRIKTKLRAIRKALAAEPPQ